MHGMSPGGNWDVDTPEGLSRSVEWMQRHVALLKDQGRWIIPRSGSIVVISHSNKTAYLVLCLHPAGEPSTQKVFEAMGWKWVDKTKGDKNG